MRTGSSAPGANERTDTASGGALRRSFWNTARFVAGRDLLIFAVGTWYFEFHIDYRFPAEENLLLYFVAVPIIWSTLIQIWTSTSYREQSSAWLLVFTHVIAMMSLASTVFLISATLNSLSQTLDSFGNALFHVVGWTVILSLVYYDAVDVRRGRHAVRRRGARSIRRVSRFRDTGAPLRRPRRPRSGTPRGGRRLRRGRRARGPHAETR